MRFLVDECADFLLVRRLRAAGHDVVAVVELSPGLLDREVLELARRERRVLVTEDKGFGQLSFLGQQGSAGILLVRGTERALLAQRLLEVVEREGERLHELFVVVSGSGTRRRPL